MAKVQQKSLITPGATTEATARPLFDLNTNDQPAPETEKPRGGHPGQRTPFLIPAGAGPEEVDLWTDLKIVVGTSDYAPETDEEKESTAYLVAVGLAQERNKELFATLRQLRKWGCGLNWTKQGGLRLNWRPCLANVPEMECSMSHKMEVLGRNRNALLGVPEEHHSRLVTLLERYLEPFKEPMAGLFREIAATWPEEARW